MNYAIITENDESQWDDTTGVSYNYPAKYANILTPGTKVIYYKGRLKNEKYRSKRLSTDPHYFGVALIGDSYLDENASRKEYYCDILEFVPFDAAVPIKMDGEYIEQIPASREANYWRDGVRPIDEETFNRILGLANTHFETNEELEVPPSGSRPIRAKVVTPINNQQTKQRSLPSEAENEASPDFLEQQRKKQIKGRAAEEEVIRFERERLMQEGRADLSEKVEDYSKRYSKGFDVLSYNADGSERHIEVKASANNGFIITRNELNKSEHDPSYWIYVVNVKASEVEIKMLQAPDLRNESKFRLEPKDYYVSFSTES